MGSEESDALIQSAFDRLDRIGRAQPAPRASPVPKHVSEELQRVEQSLSPQTAGKAQIQTVRFQHLPQAKKPEGWSAQRWKERVSPYTREF